MKIFKRGFPWFFGVAIVLVALCQSFNPFPNNDLFWQLRAGQEILGGHGLPHFDTFSWSRFGAPWIALEWGALVFLASAFNIGGFGGVWVLLCLLLMALAGFVFWFSWLETGSAWGSFALTLGLLVGCGVFWQPRPPIYSHLFLSLLVALAVAVHRSRVSSRHVFWAVPLLAVWANFHPGAVVGVAVLGLLALGDAIQAFVLRRSEAERARLLFGRARLFGLAALVGVGAIGLTPYGWKPYQVAYETVSNTPAMSFVGEWLPTRPDGQIASWTLFALVALAVWALRKTRKPVVWGEVLVLAALGWSAFSHARNIPLFALSAVLILAPHLQSAWQSLEKTVPLRWSFALVSLCVAFSAAGALNRYSDKAVESRSLFDSIGRTNAGWGLYPDAACGWMISHDFPQPLRLFNDYDFGGFQIWRTPQYPVFVDGREDVYLGPLLDGYANIGVSLRSGAPLSEQDKRYLDSYDFDCVLTGHPLLAGYFGRSPDYALVYADRAASLSDPRINHWIFLRHRPQFQSLIERCQRDWAMQNAAMASH